MQTRQGHGVDALRAVQLFLLENEASLGGVARSGARQRLDAVLAQLEVQATDQASGALEQQMATQLSHVRRDELVRLHMAAIVAAARLEARRIPELAALRMPRGNLSVARLAAEAMGMASMASKHEAVFLAAGLPPNFVEELREAAQGMTDARGFHLYRRASVGGATTGIRVALTTGRRLVALLDKLIRRDARHDSALLMSWEAVKQTHRIGRRAPRAMLGSGASMRVLASPEMQRLLAPVERESHDHATHGDAAE